VNCKTERYREWRNVEGGSVTGVSDILLNVATQWGDGDIISFPIYTCQLVFAAILWVKLQEMFVTIHRLNTLCWYVNDHNGHFLKTTDSILFK